MLGNSLTSRPKRSDTRIRCSLYKKLIVEKYPNCFGIRSVSINLVWPLRWTLDFD